MQIRMAENYFGAERTENGGYDLGYGTAGGSVYGNGLKGYERLLFHFSGDHKPGEKGHAGTRLPFEPPREKFCHTVYKDHCLCDLAWGRIQDLPTRICLKWCVGWSIS